MNNLCSAGY